MEPDRHWCRIASVDAAGVVTRSWLLRGPGRPDLAAVDALARQALEAARRGERLVVDEVDPVMADLLRLAALPVELQG